MRCFAQESLHDLGPGREVEGDEPPRGVVGRPDLQRQAADGTAVSAVGCNELQPVPRQDPKDPVDRTANAFRSRPRHGWMYPLALAVETPVPQIPFTLEEAVAAAAPAV